MILFGIIAYGVVGILQTPAGNDEQTSQSAEATEIKAGADRDGSTPSSTASTSAQPDLSKRVCRTREVTGSLVRSKKTCRTLAEWNRIEQEEQRQLREYVDHGRGGSRGN